MTHYRAGDEGYCGICNRIEAAYPDGKLYHHFLGAARDYGQVDTRARCEGSGQPAQPVPDTPDVEEFAFKELAERRCQRKAEAHRAHIYIGPMGRQFWCEGHDA